MQLPKFLPKMQAAQIKGLPEIIGLPGKEREKIGIVAMGLLKLQRRDKNLIGIVVMELPKLQGRGERNLIGIAVMELLKIGGEKKTTMY